MKKTFNKNSRGRRHPRSARQSAGPLRTGQAGQATTAGVLKLDSPARAQWFLAVLTCACMFPFLGEAFHIDDPLFLATAKQIVQHPLDPYGFSVVWYTTGMPMSEVTKNPPLAAYFLALVGSWAGWSEQVLHLAFLVPALVVILGVYHLARELTESPVIAACATLVAPGFLVSANSVMCDVPMLAVWIVAIILWRKGLTNSRLLWLVASGVLIGVCALTKYFGGCLIPLLFLYTIASKRRFERSLLLLLIPVAMLVSYQAWTHSQYGHGLLSDATSYVSLARSDHPNSTAGVGLIAMCFVGGCTLPALFFAPLLWPRTWILGGGILAVLGAAAIVNGWVSIENPFPDRNRTFLAVQFGMFVLGGISALALAAADFWRRQTADSILLTAWVLGTFIFAAFFNWTVNARSILPLIPAVGLLIARRLDDTPLRSRWSSLWTGAPIILSLVLGLWIAGGDAALANSARTAAGKIHQRAVRASTRVLFMGHWGFQYYMESFGAQPIDLSRTELTPLDVVVRPENNTNVVPLPPRSSTKVLTIEMKAWVTTMRAENGAGFYSSVWGPMPFAFGPVPPERYDSFRFSGSIAVPDE